MTNREIEEMFMKVMRTQVRIETRLVRLMSASNLDANGNTIGDTGEINTDTLSEAIRDSYGRSTAAGSEGSRATLAGQ